jgi:hypothetical protein
MGVKQKIVKAMPRGVRCSLAAGLAMRFSGMSHRVAYRGAPPGTSAWLSPWQITASADGAFGILAEVRSLKSKNRADHALAGANKKRQETWVSRRVMCRFSEGRPPSSKM